MTPRKQFGKTWWARRWIGVLESFGWANRLQRGRSYARAGRVLSVDVQPGVVKARVQGTRPKPYVVRITVPVLTDTQWERVIDAMADRAVFMAKLLAGEMPQNIEEAFEAAGVHLFPTSSLEIDMSCTCPDWAVPCKHIAATHYVLGEMFDYDPFLLFLLRGRSREELLDALQARHAATEVSLVGQAEEIVMPNLAEALTEYWGDPDVLRNLSTEPEPPPVPDAMLRRLGPFPEEWAADRVQRVLAPAYASITRHVLNLIEERNGDAAQNNREGEP